MLWFNLKVKKMEATQDQVIAIDFLADAILKKKKKVAFIAPGGCGKTFSLKNLKKHPLLEEEVITFTATTNKAASIMRKEGIDEAITLHSAISAHIPTKAFCKLAMAYDVRKNEGVEIELDQDGMDLLSSFGVEAKDFYSYKNEKELIAENGVDSFDDRVFSHYSTSEYKGGVVCVDEASMLPKKSQYDSDGKMKAIGLDAVEKVYDTVILVGDDSQLPPINGKSSFEGLERVELTKNLRADDKLLRVLDYARKGGSLANYTPEVGEPVTILIEAGSQYYVMDELIKGRVAHIVYRNKTRKDITRMIRKSLDANPREGEPLVYKGATIDNEHSQICKNEVGFYNGFVGEWDSHKQSVNGRHFDEYNDGFSYLQYGYAITAHTAQGSSYDHVVVHVDDIPHFIDNEARRKWIYTALSRARKSIVVIY